MWCCIAVDEEKSRLFHSCYFIIIIGYWLTHTISLAHFSTDPKRADCSSSLSLSLPSASLFVIPFNSFIQFWRSKSITESVRDSCVRRKNWERERVREIGTINHRQLFEIYFLLMIFLYSYSFIYFLFFSLSFFFFSVYWKASSSSFSGQRPTAVVFTVHTVRLTILFSLCFTHTRSLSHSCWKEQYWNLQSH